MPNLLRPLTFSIFIFCGAILMQVKASPSGGSQQNNSSLNQSDSVHVIVYMKFFVDKNGIIQDPKVLIDCHNCDSSDIRYSIKSAMGLLDKMPIKGNKDKKGMKRNKYYVLPLKFVYPLTENKIKDKQK
jgi:hypothetical protein